ncbi:MAG: FitA-like ribbon-helix-helix domain-containing protein [Cyanobacteriota bacterium]
MKPPPAHPNLRPLATLTSRNVPDDLVARLKERAKRYRRRLNSETIAALERENHSPERQPMTRAEAVQALWTAEPIDGCQRFGSANSGIPSARPPGGH